MAATVAAAALALAACASDDDGGGDTASTEDTGGGAETERSGRAPGVTADSIKVGLVMVDYEAISEYVDFYRGDQQETAQVFVDWINENGGVGGRRIEPVYKTYAPVPGQEPSALTTCTALTEDDEVFAVVGVFIDFTGDAQLCLTRDHNTIHIGHELEQPWYDASPAGLLLSTDSVLERDARSLVELLDEEGTLEGRTVAVLGDTDGQSRIDDVILPALEETGVDQGTTGVLTLGTTDTSAAQAQLDGFMARWEDEGVDTFFISGLRASATQWVEQLKAEFPDAQLVVDASAVIEQARDATIAGTDPNPYEGVLSIVGETDIDQWEDNEQLQECVAVYEEATGETVAGPEQQETDAEGRTNQVWIAVRDFCGELLMFRQIAEAAGPELTTESWQAAVADFGKLTLPSTTSASVCEDKYAATDAVRIVEFDPSVGDTGNWVPVTDVIDVSGDECG